MWQPALTETAELVYQGSPLRHRMKRESSTQARFSTRPPVLTVWLLGYLQYK